MTTAPSADRPESRLVTAAIDYLRQSLSAAATAPLDAATPCPDWDLRALLLHIADVADALTRCLASGELLMLGVAEEAGEPLGLARRRTATFAGEIAVATDGPGRTTAAQGAAIEFTLHGWDLAESAGGEHTMPSDLAGDVLALASSLIPIERQGLPFAAVVQPATGAGPVAELLGFTGRQARS